MGSFVQITWEELGLSARMRLLEEQAPDLCEAFKECLPLRSISWHAVISGENVGFTVPIVWTKFDNPQERHTGGAFLYANGQIIVIPYGDTTEPGDVNVFAEIPEESLDTVAKAGRMVGERFRSGDQQPVFVRIEPI